MIKVISYIILKKSNVTHQQVKVDRTVVRVLGIPVLITETEIELYGDK